MNYLPGSTRFQLSVLLILFGHIFFSVAAQPMYDEGSLNLLGIQLLQDKADKNAFYYVPTTPRLAQKSDSTFEILFIKYTGKTKESNGGIFHALIEFSLPQELIVILESELKKKNSKAYLKGSVTLMENTPKDGEEVEPSFRIISAVLSGTTGKEAMTTQVIASGKAPITPGSKAAVAAQLSQSGATLLWNSLQSPTSDISVSIDAYYEATVNGYNATVTADAKTVYAHFSEIHNNQGGFEKSQIRKVIDSLAQSGGIKIEVFDRSQTLSIKTADMESILSLFTNKITDIMFNVEKGWASTPDKVNYKDGFNEAGKNKPGLIENLGSQAVKVASLLSPTVAVSSAISGILLPNHKNKYIRDDQYILKDIKDIRERLFTLNLNKSSTVKVPIHSAGNLGGFFENLNNPDQYFKIVNMEDATFQRKEVGFVLNGKYLDGFGDWVNNVTVNFRKKYSAEQSDVTGRISFLYDEVKKGVQVKTIDYPRLGIPTDDWEEYEYQVQWNLAGGKTLNVPADQTGWLKNRNSVVNLDFPLEKSEIYIDADKEMVDLKGVKSIMISFASTVFGDKRKVRDVLIRSTDIELNKKINIYHDPNQAKIYRVTWYYGDKEKTEELQLVKDSHYITLIPK